MMNREQAKGILERLVYILSPIVLGWLGYKGGLSPEMSASIVTVILTIMGLFLGWKQNTSESLAVAAARQEDIVGITTTNPEVKKAVDDSKSADASVKLVQK